MRRARPPAATLDTAMDARRQRGADDHVGLVVGGKAPRVRRSPPVGSPASSSTITFSFSPAISVGQSSTECLQSVCPARHPVRWSRAETPIVMSASATVVINEAKARRPLPSCAANSSLSIPPWSRKLCPLIVILETNFRVVNVNGRAELMPLRAPAISGSWRWGPGQWATCGGQLLDTVWRSVVLFSAPGAAVPLSSRGG